MGYVWALALAGLFLIYLEFALPGGIMAIGGALLLLSSIVLFFVTKPAHHHHVLYILTLAVALFSIVKVALWKFRANKKAEEEPPSSIDLEDVIGKTAMTATDLLPHGQVFLGEEVFDAESKDGHIPRGAKVTVVKDEKGRLIVKAIESENN